MTPRCSEESVPVCVCHEMKQHVDAHNDLKAPSEQRQLRVANVALEQLRMHIKRK